MNLVGIFCLAGLGQIAQSAPFSFYITGDTRSGDAFPGDFAQHIVNILDLDRDSDAKGIALFNSGDVTADGAYNQLELHMHAIADGDPNAWTDGQGITRSARVRSEAAGFASDYMMYVPLVGNHDVRAGQWLENWNQFFPYQQGLPGAANSRSGLYFALRYQNAAFFVLDSENYSDSQATWLRQQLETTYADVKWRIAFLHRPVYPCGGGKSPWGSGLAFVRLFEEFNFDLVNVGHSHTFERTCPMRGGACDDTGVVFLNPSGGNQRRSTAPNYEATVSGSGRQDHYSCSEILMAEASNAYNFCQAVVYSDEIAVDCYISHNMQIAYDSFSIYKAGNSPTPSPYPEPGTGGAGGSAGGSGQGGWGGQPTGGGVDVPAVVTGESIVGYGCHAALPTKLGAALAALAALLARSCGRRRDLRSR